LWGDKIFLCILLNILLSILLAFLLSKISAGDEYLLSIFKRRFGRGRGISVRSTQRRVGIPHRNVNVVFNRIGKRRVDFKLSGMIRGKLIRGKLIRGKLIRGKVIGIEEINHRPEVHTTARADVGARRDGGGRRERVV
jgi:hypothetical protein